MKTLRIAVAALALIAFVLPTPLLACGKERWSVKVVTDKQKDRIEPTPHPATINQLRQIPAPINPNVRSDSRYAPTEFTVYEVTGKMTLIKAEADEDYHIVITDDKGLTMIVESAAPNCGKDSRFAAEIRDVRAAIDKEIPTVAKKPQTPNKMVTVTGVGFFDHIHGQTGVAPNGIELHPILAIVFHPDQTHQALKQRLHKKRGEQ